MNKRLDVMILEASSLRTVRECVEMMDRLDGAIAHMEQELYRARSDAATTGVYMETEHFSRTTFALKTAKRKRNRIQERRSELRRLEKEAWAITYERAFIDVAKKELDPEMFRSISKSAARITTGC